MYIRPVAGIYYWMVSSVLGSAAGSWFNRMGETITAAWPTDLRTPWVTSPRNKKLTPSYNESKHAIYFAKELQQLSIPQHLDELRIAIEKFKRYSGLVPDFWRKLSPLVLVYRRSNAMQVPVANDVSKLLDEAGVVAFETLRNEIISRAAATWTEVPGVFVMCSTPPLSSVRFEKSRVSSVGRTTTWIRGGLVDNSLPRSHSAREQGTRISHVPARPRLECSSGESCSCR